MPAYALALEFAVLFIGLPLVIRYARVHPFVVLWLGTAYCLFLLLHDPGFPAAQLWNLRAGLPQWPGVLGTFAVLGLAILLGVRIFVPEQLFSLVRHRPRLWVLIMVLYPVLSVYPQSVVYRAFLMYRYAPLLVRLPQGMQPPAMVLLSAAAFGFMHIIFRNRLAVAMTALGGLLFAWRYQVSSSLAVSAIEHALYGCLLFTVGLGSFFFHGTVRAARV